METGEVFEYHKSACKFGYRESIFKAEKLDKLLITSVTFALTKESKQPKWKTDYAGVREALQGKQLTAELISDAIIAIRQSKLPDPASFRHQRRSHKHAFHLLRQCLFQPGRF